MGQKKERPRPPGYVVLQEVEDGLWQLVGEADRRPGQSARAARARAIADASAGRAKPGEPYAAVLRSEWRIARDW
jgi:hypothetical protein